MNEPQPENPPKGLYDKRLDRLLDYYTDVCPMDPLRRGFLRKLLLLDLVAPSNIVQDAIVNLLTMQNYAGRASLAIVHYENKMNRTDGMPLSDRVSDVRRRLLWRVLDEPDCNSQGLADSMGELALLDNAYAESMTRPNFNHWVALNFPKLADQDNVYKMGEVHQP